MLIIKTNLLRSKFNKLNSQVQKILILADYCLFSKERTKEASELILKILFLVGWMNEKFIEEWQRGLIKPSNEELSLLKRGCDEVLEAFDNHFKKELLDYQIIPYTIHYAKTKQKISGIRKLIQ